jgi:hypothetical protein
MNSVKTTNCSAAVVIPVFCAMFNGRREGRIAGGTL